MKKRVLAAAVLALTMLMGTTLNTLAADNDIITFDGDTKSFVTDIGGDAQNGFEGMLPGESRTLTMNLYNEASEELKFFMNSDILEKDIAEQGDQRAVYDFSIQKDNETFFQAVIGGEATNNISAGKEFLTEDNRILLATLKKGERSELSITIALDGDSMGEEYMNAAGKLKFEFSAETPEAAPTIVDKVVKYVKGETKTVIKRVKTGDALPIGIMAAAGISLVVIIFMLVKKKKDREEEA